MAETVACFLVAGLVVGAPAGMCSVIRSPWPLWSVSLTRREFLVRAEQAEHMLAETRRAQEARPRRPRSPSEGTLEAGPADGTWRVALRIPA